MFVDWKRPFTEPNENSMDFESGKSYQFFMAYYADTDKDNNKSKVYADVNKKSKNAPNFVTLYFQKLAIPEDAPEESNYVVKTGAI